MRCCILFLTEIATNDVQTPKWFAQFHGTLNKMRVCMLARLRMLCWKNEEWCFFFGQFSGHGKRHFVAN